jgi:2-iminobutanoate/2-iminopropanoate deaminase
MARRHSIHIPGFAHKNPIPAACRIGNLVETGLINGTDPVSGKFGATPEEQFALMLGHVKAIVEAAGGTTDDIIKLTVWVRDRSMRAALNGPWVEMFPDEHSRPARHTMKGDFDEPAKFAECSFVAVIG